MDERFFTNLQTQQAADLRRRFPGLSERDLALLLLAPPAYGPAVLQRCFGKDAADAKAAWNDYVLRYIDGAPHQENENRRPR